MVTTALTPFCTDSNLILTGDSEGSLRCWNMQRPEYSNYLCGPYRNQSMENSFKENLQVFFLLKKFFFKNLNNMSCMRYKYEMVNNGMLKVQKEERKDIKHEFKIVSNLQVKIWVFLN